MTTSISDHTSPGSLELSAGSVRDLLEREAAWLDEQRWEQWLDLFTADCVYWVPAWQRTGKLGSDPSRELSLIYYSSRAGLEDRVVRIKSEQSAAGRPAPRTTHIVSNIIVDDHGSSDSDEISARASFVTHIFTPRHAAVSVCFGNYKVRLRRTGSGWKIASKIITLQNDHIASYLDIYCL